MHRILVIMIAAVALCLAGQRAQALENENLLVTMPKGYKVGFQKRQGNQMISEMVPENESVENWTEMVTVQIFFGMRDVTPAAYRGRIEKLWAEACPNSTFVNLHSAPENGYPIMMWAQKCPLNAKTGKREVTWMKAIAGQDSFYLVQKAFKSEPSTEQRRDMLDYFEGVRVCDTRVKEKPCNLAR